MKKILKFTILIPSTVKILLQDKVIYFKGPHGTTSLNLLDNIFIYKKNQLIHIIYSNTKNKDLISLLIKLISNKIYGVSKGFFSQLECNGLGYKAKIENRNTLVLKLGFSHKLKIKIPNNIKIFCSKSNKIIFFSVEKDKLFEFIIKVKNLKKPDSYKGKGLIFKNENLKLKEGKKL